MPTKIVAALVAVALMLAFLGPIVFKMKDVALTSVILIGMAGMLVDLWYSLRSPDD